MTRAMVRLGLLGKGFKLSFWMRWVHDWKIYLCFSSYLETAYSPISIIFVVAESLSKRSKHSFRRTGQARTARDKQTTRQDWTRQVKRGYGRKSALPPTLKEGREAFAPSWSGLGAFWWRLGVILDHLGGVRELSGKSPRAPCAVLGPH